MPFTGMEPAGDETEAHPKSSGGIFFISPVPVKWLYFIYEQLPEYKSLSFPCLMETVCRGKASGPKRFKIILQRSLQN